MELIRGLHNVLPRHRACAATIGNFDGVHVGHQRVMQLVREKANELKVNACVISFEPLPAEFFAPAGKAPPRLTGLREKYRKICKQGIDQLLLLPFNNELASTQAPDFIEKVLINGLNIKSLLVGDDFRFGRNRTGDFDLLQQVANTHGFSIAGSPTHEMLGERISSSKVRTQLAVGNLDASASLLGSPYAIEGRISYGAQKGRTIGFPTANINLGKLSPPLRGVFAVSATVGMNKQAMAGIANLGIKPTVNGQQLSLEVHLLDYSADIYRQLMRVEFLHKLRDEKKFSSFDELKLAIANDETNARRWFTNNTSFLHHQ